MHTRGIASSVVMLLVVWAAGCAAPKEASLAQTAAATPEAVLPSTDTAAVGNAPAPRPTSPQTEPAHPFKVVAYYFHRTIRCPSCLRIEEYAKNAVESMFPQEIADGVVEWRTLNMERTDNARFVESFKLETPSLILERIEGNVRRDWKNLDKVWDLLHDQGVFTVYVHEELEKMLGEGQPGPL